MRPEAIPSGVWHSEIKREDTVAKSAGNSASQMQVNENGRIPTNAHSF